MVGKLVDVRAVAAKDLAVAMMEGVEMVAGAATAAAVPDVARWGSGSTGPNVEARSQD